MAVNLKVTGFSDKIFVFAKTYIELLLWCANKDGFDKASVLQAIEKCKQDYANNSTEVDEKATHNRLLMLIPHSFHDKLMEKEL